MVRADGIRRWGHASAKPFARHRRGAIQKVPDRVGQIVIDQVREALLLKITVITKGDVPQQIPAHRIRSATLEQLLRIQHIAQGFTHLLAFPREKAVPKHRIRNLESGREQHGGPEDGMEPQDVFADHMHLGRPPPAGEEVEIDRIAGIEQGGEIAKQGIKPHIEGMAGMARNRNTPRKILAGD